MQEGSEGKGCHQGSVNLWVPLSACLLLPAGFGSSKAPCNNFVSAAPGSTPLVAVEGDIVTLNWKCFSEEGEVGAGCGLTAARACTQMCREAPLIGNEAASLCMCSRERDTGRHLVCRHPACPPPRCLPSGALQLLESSDTNEEPTTFEVGAGDIVGNRLFEVSAGGCLIIAQWGKMLGAGGPPRAAAVASCCPRAILCFCWACVWWLLVRPGATPAAYAHAFLTLPPCLAACSYAGL